MLEYLKTHILEELEGATDYWTKAVEYKDTEWGCNFCKMAEMEIEHASMLTKMMSKEKNPKNSDAFKEVLDAYTDHMAKIEAMKKLYWRDKDA